VDLNLAVQICNFDEFCAAARSPPTEHRDSVKYHLAEI
jgi:hypothetical protein